MENYQKIKLLKLHEMLLRKTDEEHPLTTNEICKRLSNIGISCDRRTLYKDMELLVQFGYDVGKCKVGRQNAYYIAEHGFSVPELRILIDAVHATKFITEKKSEELIKKISELAGQPEAELLLHNSTIYNTCKHQNEFIYYNISMVEDAIRLNRQISFYYFDLNEMCDRVYRKNKERYKVEPIALMLQDEKYYLLTYYQKHKNIVTYRLDRMESVIVENNMISEDARKECFDLSKYAGAVYNMYSGKTNIVRLRFSNNLIGVIYDQYGEDIPVKRIDEQKCQCDIRVEISPTFWGWLFQFGDEMEIVKPKQLKEEYIERCRKILQINQSALVD